MYLMWKRIYPKELIFMSQQDCLCNSIKTGYVPLSIAHTQKMKRNSPACSKCLLYTNNRQTFKKKATYHKTKKLSKNWTGRYILFSNNYPIKTLEIASIFFNFELIKKCAFNFLSQVSYVITYDGDNWIILLL